MSERLMSLVDTFLRQEGDPEQFVNDFISQWKHERDSGKASADPPQLSEALSSIFCLADMFNADPEKEEYELDESQLRSEVKKVIRNQ